MTHPLDERLERKRGRAAGGAAAAAETEATERERFYADHPFEPFWRSLRRRAEARAAAAPTGFARFWRPVFAPQGLLRLAAGAGAAALFLAAGILWGQGLAGRAAPVPAGPGGGSERVKGSQTGGASPRLAPPAAPVGLRFFVWRDGQAQLGTPRGAFTAGEALRFRYWSGGNRYLYLFSLEESGDLHIYYPDGGGPSMAIAPGTGLVLPDGVILDDYRGYERFFALFSHEPLAEATVRQATADALALLRSMGGDLRDLERLPLACDQTSFWIHKE